jgi:hypothetical protein
MKKERRGRSAGAGKSRRETQQDGIHDKAGKAKHRGSAGGRNEKVKSKRDKMERAHAMQNERAPNLKHSPWIWMANLRVGDNTRHSGDGLGHSDKISAADCLKSSWKCLRTYPPCFLCFHQHDSPVPFDSSTLMIRTSVPREWPAFTRRASISSLLDDPYLSAERMASIHSAGIDLVTSCHFLMIRTSVPREWPAFTRRASISSLQQ